MNERHRPPVNLDSDLWRVDEIAAYFHRNREAVKRDIISRPTFPRGECPTGKPTGERLWLASQVKRFAFEMFGEAA